MHVTHENETEAKKLPGRNHKMIIGPDNFGHAKHMCFGVAFFPPKKHAPAHTHDIQEEIIYVIEGHGNIYFDGVPEKVEAGSCAYIPPNVEHSIENLSEITLKVAYVFSPPAVQGSYDKQ